MGKEYLRFTLGACAALVACVCCDLNRQPPGAPYDSTVEPAQGRRGTQCTIGFWTDDGRPEITYLAEVRWARDSSGPFVAYDEISCEERTPTMGPTWGHYYEGWWTAVWPHSDSALPYIRIYPMATNGRDTATGEPVQFIPTGG